MIDLSTTYLGLQLRNPLVCSPSPLCEDLDNVRHMEDMGAAAIVLHSLFEEQLQAQSDDLDSVLQHTSHTYAESLSFFPDMTDYNLGPEGYLTYIQRAKHAVNIPILGSLNGCSPG